VPAQKVPVKTMKKYRTAPHLFSFLKIWNILSKRILQLDFTNGIKHISLPHCICLLKGYLPVPLRKF